LNRTITRRLAHKFLPTLGLGVLGDHHRGVFLVGAKDAGIYKKHGLDGDLVQIAKAPALLGPLILESAAAHGSQRLDLC
jgi:hypothetical protein